MTNTDAGRNDHIHGDEHLGPEMGQFECSCGEDYYYDVKREGYPKWHAPLGKPIRFVDECRAPHCDKRVCHDCVTACKICGRRYCPDHATEDLKHFGLCEDCAGLYPEIPAGAERDKLIEIEGRMEALTGRTYYNSPQTAADLKTVLDIAKEALAQAPKRSGIA
jgi:hypothetical protein